MNSLLAPHRCFNCGARLHSDRLSCKRDCDPNLLSVKQIEKIIQAAAVGLVAVVAACVALMLVLMVTQ